MPVASQWFAAPDTTYEISQSARFNDDDSSYLHRTPSSAGNRRTWTWSGWVKRGNLGSKYFFGAVNTGTDSIGFTSTGIITIGFNNANDGKLQTNRLFRDVSAWYHIVVGVDTTSGTAGDRIRLYVNGVEETSFSADVAPSLNYDTGVNNTVSNTVGSLSAPSGYFDGYLAEVHLVDGSQLTAASFGETDSTTGQWVPKAYSGSYGTNGFYLQFQDSSAFGDDTSGNGNDFTSSGLAAADQMSDSPTDNHCTLNPLWVDQHTLSDGNLVASAAGDSAAIGTMAFDVTDSDGFYFEAKVTTAATYPNVGIRTVESPSQVGAVTSLSGNSTGRYSFTGSDGNFNDAGSSSSYGSAWAGTADKVIGVLVKAGALYFSIDGTIQNSGTAAKTGLTGYMLPTVFYDAGSGTSASWEMRFDASDWGTSPSGYKAISSNNLADPTIDDPSAYFQTTLYAGNGSTQSITNGGNSNLQPDLIWIKNRSATDNHVLTDAVRGATKIISSDSRDAETTDADTVTAFASDGFALGADDKVNTSSENYVAWQWKEGSTPGFDIVTYTGTGSGANISHSLGVKPSVVIVKCRSDSSTHWIVNDWSGDYANKLKLNETEAASGSSGFVTAATSSTFTLGTDTDVNGSSRTYVAYCFAEVESFSSFGSYVGNGSATDGPFVYTGFRPALVVTKNITNSGDAWPVADSARAPFNVANATVFWNLNNAETTGYSVDLLSNGFRPFSSDHGINESGATYIYAAWAESPFKTATAR